MFFFFFPELGVGSITLSIARYNSLIQLPGCICPLSGCQVTITRDTSGRYSPIMVV